MTTAEQKKKYLTWAALIATAFLLIAPVRSLLADGWHRRALALVKTNLDAPGETVGLSGPDMQNYRKAVTSLERAASLVPGKGLYRKALADLYLKLGIEAGIMETKNMPLPPGSLKSRQAYEKALFNLNKAVRLEPSNPDYHYALGCLHDRLGRYTGSAEKELARAIAAYPMNAPLRYAVAVEHAKNGRTGDALEQARELAKIADNESYLVRAFEIAWSATQDREVVRGIAPDTAWAAASAERFLNAKRAGERK